jgi:FlaA1/EpsC-like NDP-sugar epimerase
MSVSTATEAFRAMPIVKPGYRGYTRSDRTVLDGAIFLCSFLAAYFLRFEGVPAREDLQQMLLWLPCLLAVRLASHWYSGVYRLIWHFVSLRDALDIIKSLSVATLLLLAIRLFWPDYGAFSHWAHVPLGIIALEFLLSLIGSLGARSLRRILFERERRATFHPSHSSQRVILYGAGKAGRLLLRELETRSDVEVAGFLDDDPQKAGSVISGVSVLGNGEQLAEIAKRFRIDEIVISMATASRQTLAQIVAKCKETCIPSKIIPSLQEILDGRVRISHLRKVEIEDLLGRRSASLDAVDEEVKQVYRGKRVLVTGASGSIGRELVPQLLGLKPCKLLMLDKDENGIYELEQEVALRFPQAAVESQIADIRQRGRIADVFIRFRPQIVFHAAAHKHVPLMEKVPCEAVLNNVLGTKVVFESCLASGTEQFVFVSTDKAVNPTSIMGATKKVGELLVQCLSRDAQMRAACVRFGNVMGSRGSVIPHFQKQIQKGGPLTVTHPEIVRFFMTIPEAVQLILCAGSLAGRGEVFVMDMGNPRKILELAREMVLLSGLALGTDIDIVITGLRPGEKLNEELTAETEISCPTRFAKLSKVMPRLGDPAEVLARINSLMQAAEKNDVQSIFEYLRAMDIGFRPGVVQPPLIVETDRLPHRRAAHIA